MVMKTGGWPKKIRLLGTDWTVSDDRRIELDQRGLRGRTICDSTLLEINTQDVSEASLRPVLIHECLHAMTEEMMDGSLCPSEAQIRCLAPMILAMLRDNPKLVAFLTKS